MPCAVIHSSDESFTDSETGPGQGWGVVRKSLVDKPSQVAGALYDKFDHPIIRQGTATVGSLTKKLGSLPASAHMLYGGSHFPNAGKFCWDKAAEFGLDIQGCTDKFFQHAREFCPSDKMADLRESVDSVASTATTLYQVVKEAAEQCGIPLYTISNNLVNTFSALFEELKEQFPPPGEASGHAKRMTMMNTVPDRFEECFLQVVGELGVSSELLKILTGSLKTGLKHMLVTIGDINEQHPKLVRALLRIIISMLSTNDPGSLLTILRTVGFGPSGLMKGGIAAWLQGWSSGPAVPNGDWFAMLQHLAMMRRAQL
ncbi:hypothetical protein BDR06DRAFT_967600 [Suillus hirtellus]|nr:hypothetical protein BDR06DRAFT_967600 [Suillus hirtellus]